MAYAMATEKRADDQPHGSKLYALAKNPKLPAADLKRVEGLIESYNAWRTNMDELEGDGDQLLEGLVELLNDYKYAVEFDLIFSSENDFLYRQKGQLKLDNTVLEEFLPRLFDVRIIPGLEAIPSLECGPRKSFSGLSFSSPRMKLSDGGVFVKHKDQDFSIARTYDLSISPSDDPADSLKEKFDVSFFASEIKTNLDKTMFQEASQTASELKRAVSGAKYVLLCEWLDMTPINTRLTAIDEVIVLRKSKRISSNVRSAFSTAQGRLAAQDDHSQFLKDHPLDVECFKRFRDHLTDCFPVQDGNGEQKALARGYF